MKATLEFISAVVILAFGFAGMCVAVILIAAAFLPSHDKDNSEDRTP